MYTSYIGKKLIDIYNKIERKNLNAEEFFNSIVYPLFFDDEKHFINVANSSFFQSISQSQLSSEKTINQVKLERFHKNVKENGASLTTLVGYAAQDITAGTSGQVSNLSHKIYSNEMYASWAGIGLAISMGGGYSILIDDPEILYGLFQGWKIYRKYLSQTPNLKGNQIEVWNSYWLCHSISFNFDTSNPLSGFTLPEPIPCKAEKWKKIGLIEFESINWIRVIFSLAKKYPNRIFTLNAFKFADTNQTIGFINVYLPEVNKLFEFRDKLFIDGETILKEEEVETLVTFYNFKQACKLGTIGLRSIEPEKLREYLPKGSFLYAQGKEYKFINNESFTNYQLFKIWIIAMLNKTELLKTASEIARILIDIECQSIDTKRGKTSASQESIRIIESKSVKGFIEELTGILDKSPSNALLLRKVVEEIIKMPYDLFPLFITLIKFEYSYITSTQKNK